MFVKFEFNLKYSHLFCRLHLLSSNLKRPSMWKICPKAWPSMNFFWMLTLQYFTYCLCKYLALSTVGAQNLKVFGFQMVVPVWFMVPTIRNKNKKMAVNQDCFDMFLNFNCVTQPFRQFKVFWNNFKL